MKAVPVFGIVVAIVMIIYGFACPVPEKEIQVSGYQDKGWAYEYGIQYVGGDAYNYQIEASLKAGYYAGVMTVKSISVVGGIVLLFISLFSLVRMLEEDNHEKTIVQAISKYLAMNREAEYMLAEQMEEILCKLPKQNETPQAPAE